MNKSQKFWDRASKSFDKSAKKENPASVKYIEETKKHLHPDDNVLDYACATGSYTLELANLVKEIHGIDISSKMIELAKKKREDKKTGNISFAESTIFSNNYSDESFDVILGFNILHLLEDSQKAVQRIKDLLKPNGKFISVTPCLGQNKFTVILFFLASKIMGLPFLKFYKKNSLVQLINNEGFRITEITKTDKTPSYFIVANKV